MVKEAPNYKLHVLYALVTAFLVVYLTNISKKKLKIVGTTKGEPSNNWAARAKTIATGDSVEQSLVGWGVIYLVLFSAVAFDSTAPLAATFAWLILISVILVNTEAIYAILNNAFTPARGGGGGTW
jgi:hypothetical protein